MVGALLLLAFFLAMLGGGFGVLAHRRWKRLEPQRRLRALPEMTATAVALWPEATVARLVGRIEGGDSLMAPLSGRPCVFYRVVVERLLGESSTTLLDVERCAPFAVHDGTGRALVDPRGATVVCEVDFESSPWQEGQRTSAAQLALLAAHGLSDHGALGDLPLRYRESTLVRGETVAVIGMAVREPDPDAAGDVTGLRAGPPTRLRVGPSPKGKLYVSDHHQATRP